MTQEEIYIMVEADNEAWLELQRAEYYAAKRHLDFGSGYNATILDILCRDKCVIANRAAWVKCRELCDKFDINVYAVNAGNINKDAINEANAYNEKKVRWLKGGE